MKKSCFQTIFFYFQEAKQNLNNNNLVFVSPKLTWFGCKRREASGRGTSRTGMCAHTPPTHTHTCRQHMVIGHSVVVLKWC